MKKKRLRIKQLRLTKRESIRLAELVLNPPPRNERFAVAMASYQEMTRRTGTENVTQVGGNVFLDLGFTPEVAVKLKTETDAIIRGKGCDYPSFKAKSSARGW